MNIFQKTKALLNVRLIPLHMAANKYRLNREIADKIASVVWYELGTKDVRDALQLAKLVRSIDEVETMSRTIMKYKPKILNPSSYLS
jgi:hypothetical protein